jgi:GAF domain-containing protein
LKYTAIQNYFEFNLRALEERVTMLKSFDDVLKIKITDNKVTINNRKETTKDIELLVHDLHICESEDTTTDITILLDINYVLDAINAMIDIDVDTIANLANAAALLKDIFGWWWVGFYRVMHDELVLGPFQGPVACTRIGKGKGVCGASWIESKTLVVPNVDEFPGHIACSSKSKSEIVVPIYKHDGEIWGVLDVDSEYLDYFNETDQIELEKFCRSLEIILS